MVGPLVHVACPSNLINGCIILYEACHLIFIEATCNLNSVPGAAGAAAGASRCGGEFQCPTAFWWVVRTAAVELHQMVELLSATVQLVEWTTFI